MNLLRRGQLRRGQRHWQQRRLNLRPPMKATDVAWLAGLLEGEGYFAPPTRGMWSPQIRILMTDRDVIERVAEFLGGANIRIRRARGRRREAYGVMLHGRQAIGVMFTVYPFMGARRQERIREAVAEWKRRPFSAKDKQACKCGALLVRPATGGARYCRVCKTRRNKLRRQRLAARRAAA